MENLWKCMDVYGKVWKKLPKKIPCPAAFFKQFFPFFVVWKMYGKRKEIYGKPMEVYGHAWKCMEKLKFVESYGNVWKIYGNLMKIYGHVWKFMGMYGNVLNIYGNLWTCMEMYGNAQKCTEMVRN